MMFRVGALAVSLVVLLGALPFAPTMRAVAQEATPEAACPTTTPEENKALVQQFTNEVYQAHNAAAVAAYLSEDFNRNNPTRPSSNEPGTADDEERVARSLREFPDLAGTIEDIIAEGDQVMVLLRIRGTQEGDFADIGAPATGRPAEWLSVVIWRVECGKLAANTVVTDRLTEYRQLGIVSDDELASVDTPTVATPTP